MISMEKVKGYYKPHSGRYRGNLYQHVKKYGILHPILVYKEEEVYIVLDGHHRWSVAQRLHLKEIPCIVIEKPIKKRR